MYKDAVAGIAGRSGTLMAGSKVRVGLVGVGNCASSFVQGLGHYADAAANEAPPGLMHVELGGYHVGDVEVAAAFDIDAGKVGRDVGDAIFASPNNTHQFAPARRTGVQVKRGHTLDGVGRYLVDDIEESEETPVNVAEELRRSGVDVLVSYLPVGSQAATEFYAEQALDAGCAFVNCIPVFIASDPLWAKRFEQRRLPIIGDDFKNMLERERLTSKKMSKTQAVTSQFDVPLDADDVHVGPSDFVPWLTDRKWAHIRLEGTTFGGLPLNVELKLEVWDSPNSAGVVIDAVRCAKLGLDRGLGGPLLGPSSYFMKSPPEQYTDNEARERTLAFIEGDGRVSAQLAS